MFGTRTKQPELSLVNNMAERLEADRRDLEKQVSELTEQAHALLEKRRQHIVALRITTAQLTALANDPALTKERAATADREILLSLEEIRVPD